jgi:hypothetical protein
MDGDEGCDDGNDVDLDGCTDCAIDPGYNCMINVSPSICEEAPDGGHVHEHDAAVPHDHHDASAPSADAGPGNGPGGNAGNGNGNAGSSNDEDASAGNDPNGGEIDAGATAASSTDEDSGCNCRLPRSSSNGAGVPAMLFALALLLRRCRRAA